MRIADDEIRDELRRRSTAGGPADELRERVRTELNKPQRTRNWWSGPRLLVAASVLLLTGGLVVGLVVVGATGGGDPVSDTMVDELTRSPASSESSTSDAATNPDPPTSASTSVLVDVTSQFSSRIPAGSPDTAQAVGVRRISSSELQVPIFFDVPATADRFAVIAETSRVMEVSLAGPSDRSPPTVPIVRIIVPDDAVSAAEVESALSGPHPDTLVTNIGDSTLGRYETRLTQMESNKGTSAVGFSVADRVFVGADGIDRVYEVHVIQTVADPIVVWIDAPRAEFAGARNDAAMLVDSLRLAE